MSAIILLAARFTLALALYAFLGWALWFLWRDMQRHSRSMDLPAIPILSFTVGGAERNTYRFSKAEVVIGRDPACDCHLQEQTISARHARFSFHHNQWWLEDLGSHNGTTLNREKVREPLVVTTGDHIRLGQVKFDLRIG